MTEQAIGIVVNPKLAEPLLVVHQGSGETIIVSMKEWVPEGSGYLDESDPAASVTGYPRSHTPSGVRQDGMGYGTSLYTGLCAVAHQSSESRLPGYYGDGISSKEGDRSTDAEGWWDAAKNRGLATLVEDEYEDRQDISHEVDADDLESCLPSLSDEYGETMRVDSVDSLVVDVSILRTADAYPFQSAERHELVPALFIVDTGGGMGDGIERSLWRPLLEDDSLIDDVTWQEIIALDVRGITKDAIQLLALLAEWGGATEDDVEAMRFRWHNGLDPSVPVAQMRLPFKANSGEARLAREANARAMDLRAKTDWGTLADLP